MPLLSFSVDAYDKARARLKELAARRGAAPATATARTNQELEDGDNGNLASSDKEEEEEETKSAVSKGSRPARRTQQQAARGDEKQGVSRGLTPPPPPPPQRQQSRQNSSSSLLDGSGGSSSLVSEEDLHATVGRDVEGLEKELVAAIKTAGLRQARESALLGVTGKLERHRRDWIDALEDRIDKWRSLARSLRRKYDQREERIEEEMAATQANADKELHLHEQRSKKLYREAESKRAAEMKALKEQHQEELKSQALAREKEQEEWRQAALKEMEDKMVADLEKTKARIKKEGKAQIDQVIASLEEEYSASLEAHESKLREARRREEQHLARLAGLMDENDSLGKEVEELRHVRAELEGTVKDLRARLDREQKAQAATSNKIQELQGSFEELVGSLKQEALDLQEAHATELRQREQQRDTELEELDTRIRKSLAAKDLLIAKLRGEVTEASKEAATARVLLKDLYDGFRPVEPITDS